MVFKDEERDSGIINVNAIWRKSADERFDEYIKKVKGWTPEERENAGRNTFAQLVKQFQHIWDDTESAFVQPLVAFINFATQIGCSGLKKVSDNKKKEVANYFQDLEAVKDLVNQREDFFDYMEFDDDSYRTLVDVFLCCSLEPLMPQGASYVNILFTYMLLVACADTVNENGIKAIKKLRSDYFDYAPRNKAGELKEFLGSYDKSMFLSPEEIKAAKEAKKKAAEEAAKKELAERKAQLGKLKSLKVGDTFFFGSYPQSSRKTSERIEWTVLDKSGSKILILSKYVLDNQSFHKSKKTTPWSDSLIRTWLDTKFIGKAFNDEEQGYILPTTIQEPGSDGVSHTTTDRVFLLSEAEVKKYFSTAGTRGTEGTKVAGNSYWGLRSYKKGADSFQYCSSGGRLLSNKIDDDSYMRPNNDCTLGVRPAMWITTSVVTPEKKAAEARIAKEGAEVAERARKEAERKKKQDIRQSAKLVCKNLLEQVKQLAETEEKAASKKVDELKQNLAQITQSEISKQKKELAADQAEFDAVSSALNAMGLFQFKQKSDAKAKLQQLQLRIDQLKQSSQAPDSADIRRVKTALEQAEKELADCSAKQKKREEAVESACSVYMERVNLHLDYISGKKLNLASKLSKSDREDYALMFEVCNQAFHATISEMRECSYVLGQLDNMKVASIARRMLEKGYLSKTVSNGRTYLDCEKYPPELIDDTDWDITRPPIAPDIDSILSKN